jgi:crotonobetainyl-CoA:carnitine CoA-transferase CaiB-like acyl-CoA transferase
MLTGGTTSEWLARFEELGIAAAAVASLEELVRDPAQHRGVLTEAVHPHVGRYLQIRPPVRFSRTPANVHRPAPLIGEDGDDVLGEL